MVSKTTPTTPLFSHIDTPHLVSHGPATWAQVGGGGPAPRLYETPRLGLGPGAGLGAGLGPRLALTPARSRCPRVVLICRLACLTGGGWSPPFEGVECLTPRVSIHARNMAGAGPALTQYQCANLSRQEIPTVSRVGVKSRR